MVAPSVPIVRRRRWARRQRALKKLDTIKMSTAHVTYVRELLTRRSRLSLSTPCPGWVTYDVLVVGRDFGHLGQLEQGV